jgi:molecular chaperone GrpE
MRPSDTKRPRRIEITTPGDEPPPAAECPFVPDAESDVPLADVPAPEGETSDQELAKLQEMIADLERQCAYAEDQHLRVAAELQNYKRRVQQEKEQLRQYANEALVTELIPIIDNFERALEVPVDSAGAECLRAGIRMVHEQLQRVLAGHGVEVIESLGADFDPHRHEAIEREETTDLPPDVITAELAKGYALNGRVIRPARVRVTALPKD